MTILESIPEDKQQSFPCPECTNGSITKNIHNIWFCDTCDFWRTEQPA